MIYIYIYVCEGERGWRRVRVCTYFQTVHCSNAMHTISFFMKDAIIRSIYTRLYTVRIVCRNFMENVREDPNRQLINNSCKKKYRFKK